MPNFASVCLARGVEGLAVKNPDFRAGLGVCVWVGPLLPVPTSAAQLDSVCQKISRSLRSTAASRGGSRNWEMGGRPQSPLRS